MNCRAKGETASAPHSVSTPLSSLHPCPHRDLQSIPHCHADLEGRRKQHCHHSLPFPQPASAAGGKSVRGASEKEGGKDPDSRHEPAGRYVRGLLLLDGGSSPRVPEVPRRASNMRSGAGSLAAGRGERHLSGTFVAQRLYTLPA